MARKRSKFEFDAAISYAGENRDVAKKLAKAFKDKGLSVFYDRNYTSSLWGKDQREFERIYSRASHFVIPIISAYYIKKDYCQFEFGVAKDEAERRKGVFLLPIRLDDTRMLGLCGDVQYLDLRHVSIPVVVRSLLNKIQRPSAKSKRKVAADESKIYRILSHSRRQSLGLIAVAPFSFRVEQLALIFPQIPWKKEVRFLREHGFLNKGKGPVRISKFAKREILSDLAETAAFHREWIKALKPMRAHIDAAIYLALQYLALKEFDEAVSLLADIAEGMEPDRWNSVYYGIFKTMYDKGLLRHITSLSRVRFYNVMGLCLSRMQDNEDAIEWFLRLRRYGRRVNNAWGIGQSYINCGVAYYQIGDTARAERCYRKSINHAKQTNDGWLLGRSLHNLAMTRMNRSPDEAMQMLEESLALKQSEDDLHGILGSMIGLGNLAASRADFHQAIKHYRKAEKKALSLDLRHIRCLALSNLGSAHVDLGEFKKAFRFYQMARRIAKEEGYEDVLLLCTQGEANARAGAKHFGRAEALFRELFELKRCFQDSLGMVISLHDVGVCLMKQGKDTEARQVFGQALGLARRTHSEEWIYRCRLNSAFSFAEKGNIQEAIKALKNSALKEQKADVFVPAGKLWHAYADLMVQQEGWSGDIEKALENSIKCLEKAGNADHDLLGVYKDFYIWKREKGDLEAALDILHKIEKLATLNHEVKQQIQAIDERGVCLQGLAKMPEAEKAHQDALKLARGIQDSECIEISLNNLGEVFRKTGRAQEAVERFIEAEQTAESRKAIESMISVRQNRAVALSELGKTEEAEKLLWTCRDTARRHKLWHEYIRSVHGLANVAWIRGKDGLAEKRYIKALAEADRQKMVAMKCAISLDYARLLRTKKRLTEAFQLLEPIKETFVKLADPYHYYITLAEIYEDQKDMPSARANWEKARQSAIQAGDKDAVAISSSALAEVYRKEDRLRVSDEELQVAFENENDPEGKALICLNRLEVLLAAKNERLAKKVFYTARTLADEHDLKETYIDLHMIMGDYSWDKGPRSQFNAMQVYISAMVRAITIDFESFAKVGVHITGRLFSIENSKRIKRIDVLHDRLSKWMSKEVETTEGRHMVESLLWPVRAAKEIALEFQRGFDLSSEAIAGVLEHEFARLFGPSFQEEAGSNVESLQFVKMIKGSNL